MINTKSKEIRSKIRVIKKLKSLHPVVEKIAINLSELDIISYVTISDEFLKASNETTIGRYKIPITKPHHPTAVGVSLILELDYKVIQFYEMCSAVRGYGSKMVDAIIRALPEDWSAVVVMDWSEVFWEKMEKKYNKIVIL